MINSVTLVIFNILLYVWCDKLCYIKFSVILIFTMHEILWGVIFAVLIEKKIILDLVL